MVVSATPLRIHSENIAVSVIVALQSFNVAWAGLIAVLSSSRFLPCPHTFAITAKIRFKLLFEQFMPFWSKFSLSPQRDLVDFFDHQPDYFWEEAPDIGLTNTTVVAVVILDGKEDFVGLQRPLEVIGSWRIARKLH
ncbi:hypothetical protein KIN20_009531 [Parelaphostrongylus tenuis]|uniref:Uncharacterized protein n=1 Tax=Parelaphostrongylus tenuis TaxID=148309 RepID=A0AAD5QIA8_PARTN|nr:hypothetical protein KIN20_009531 [Parelaphostrongylus tenuis]